MPKGELFAVGTGSSKMIPEVVIRPILFPEADRIRASEIVLDRVMGKAKESIAVELEAAPWQRVIANAIVPTLSEATGVIESEVVEETG